MDQTSYPVDVVLTVEAGPTTGVRLSVPRFLVGEAVVLRISAAGQGSGQVVNPSGWSVEVLRPDLPDWLEIVLPVVHKVADGEFRFVLTLDVAGPWIVRIRCSEPSASVGLVRMLAVDAGAPLGPALLASPDTLLTTPSVQPFRASLVTSLAPMAPLAGDETMVGVQLDGEGIPQARTLTVQTVRNDVLAVVQPIATEVTETGKAVQEARVEVEGNREAVAGDLTLSNTARNASLAARDAASDFAAQAAAAVLPVNPQPDDTSKGFTLTDQDGFTSAEGSLDGLTLKLMMATLQGLADGTLNISRRDGAQLLQILADGVGLGGAVIGASTDGALTARDQDGFIGMQLEAAGAAFAAAGFRWANLGGNVAVFYGPDGAEVMRTTGSGSLALAAPTLAGASFSSDARTDYSVIFPDSEGFFSFALDKDGKPLGNASGGAATSDFSVAEVMGFDADVLAAGQRLASTRKMLTQPVIEGTRNAINAYGQSLSVSAGNTNPLSTTAFSTTWMVGTTPRFASSGGSLSPVGDGAFHPLVTVGGELFVVSAVNGFRRYDAALHGLPLTSNRRLVGTNTAGVPGRTLEALSYGAAAESGNTQNYWTGLQQVFQAQKAAAQAEGVALVCPVMLFDQGQANAGGSSSDGLAHTAEAWCAKFLQLVADFDTYITGPILGQDYSPLWLINQTGGRFQSDAFQLGVSQGQLLAAQRDARVVLVQGAGNLQSSGTDAHPTANAYRQLGEKFAQAMTGALHHGRGWDFMRPVSVVYRGTTVLIGVLPRKGPIHWATPFSGYTQVDPTAYASRGFAARDSLGAIDVIGVTLAGQGTIKLTLARAPVDAPFVSAGSVAAGGGMTFVEDSDDQRPFNNYVFASGMNDAENIAALVGKPLSMANQLATFYQQATAI
ncbi:hypothetical protein [Roseomonas chloroacetimidivorans]|uniref:hypothetical protein n=1 Tax=Roseomonas chloroacetimidivorans TaxID=1766656 RepID=UPI003C787DD0